MKKILAMLLALVMVFGLAACGKTEAPTPEVPAPTDAQAEAPTEGVSEPKDPVTIAYWYGNGVGEQEYTKQVEEELNKLLKETPGYEHITIDLVPCKDYKTDLALALSSGTQVDLISTASYGTSDKIDLGEYLPLDDLIAANPEITADLPEWFVNYGKEDGILYYIPNYQQLCNTMFWVAPAEYVDKAGYTYDQLVEIIKSEDLSKHVELEKNLVDAARELGKNAYIDSFVFLHARRYTGASNSLQAFDYNSYFYLNPEDNTIHWTDTDKWNTDLFKTIPELRAEGYVYLNQLTDEEYLGTTITDRLDPAVASGCTVSSIVEAYGTREMVEASLESAGYPDIYAVPVGVYDELVLPAKNAAGGVAIASNSEHVEDAAKVIALLFNGKYEQFYNTLCYGIEGIHYNKISDGRIETVEFTGTQAGSDSTYAYHKWRGGNTFNAWNNQSLSDEQEDYILHNINEGDNCSVAAGFIFDTTGIETEMEQCTAVVAEYIETLRYGLKDADWEAYYNEYINKMKTAGIDTIIDEYTRQFNEFLSNN